MTTEQAKIFIGSDHAGFALKQVLLPRWREKFNSLLFEDEGCLSEASVDYPTFAIQVAQKVIAQKARGILICGSGVGMAITANKVRGIRAAQVWDVTSARLSREHNDSNIVCLGARLIGSEVAFEAVSVWLQTAFQGGRHQSRLHLIAKLEGEL